MVENLLTRPGFVLLAFGAEDVTALSSVLGDLGTVVRVVTGGTGAPEDDVVDAGRLPARAYGLTSGGLALVRPDGYLALVADSLDEELLRRYLTDTLRVRGGVTAGGAAP